MAGAVFLGALNLFPIRPDLIHVLDPQIAKDMRMPANQLVSDVPGDFIEIKSAPFAAQLAVKHHLQQQVAQFLGHLVIVPGLDGVEQFVNLFHCVPTQSVVILLTIPGAAFRRAQPGHDTEQVTNGILGFHLD